MKCKISVAICAAESWATKLYHGFNMHAIQPVSRGGKKNPEKSPPTAAYFYPINSLTDKVYFTLPHQ